MARRQAWQRRLNEGRWAAINWPQEWGGREATTMQNVIYSEVMAQAKAPGIYNANGIWQIGPMIIRWGTDEQKQRGCPGSSAPPSTGARASASPRPGSDLANLRTARDRRRRRVRRQRHEDLDLDRPPRQVGPVPRAHRPRPPSPAAPSTRASPRSSSTWSTPGVQCNPIREITGEAMFCEVVFTDARVPAAYRLGERGRRLERRHGHAHPRAGRHRRHRHRPAGRARRR